VAGDEIHPVVRRTYRELWDELGGEAKPLAAVNFDFEYS
jgi:hypothetical protein